MTDNVDNECHTGIIGDDKAFLWDDNIPSIPTIPILSSPTPSGESDTHKRRNRLLRMISDPKCYNTREQLVQARRHQSVAEVIGGVPCAW